ncbi:MAG: sugar phosphate isomerase/epimerase [Pirellulaceae bacterium]|jgi:sugar phosphate isomerase/epimerase|nr:sugar phosphate isomerase/epimerase [Pirellulaceae bacterium]
MLPSLSRRRLLALSAAAAAGATWFDAPRVLAAANLVAADDAFGGFPVGVQSYSLRNFNTDEVVRHLQGMGVHYTEFYSKHLDTGADDAKIAEVLALLEKADIKLAGHGVHSFGKDHAANKKLFEFAKKAGVKVITANPEAASFDSLDELVKEYDIRIAIHNHGPGALFDKLGSVTKAIAGRDKRIGACVDCGHFLRSGEDPVKCVLELGDRVYGVHIKDEKETGTPKSANVVIGRGHLDVVGLFKALRKVKFPADGSLALEYEANPDNPIEEMKACLAVAKEAIAKSA